jgi:flagellar hook-associated protein 3 FlgL
MIVPRITLGMAHRQSLADLNSIRQRGQEATNQISSGLRIRNPSDGPAEAAGIVLTNSDIHTAAQFRSNLQNVDNQLRSVDAVLNQAGDVLQRAETLASQGSNFTQTAATRASMATEVDGLLQQMITLANTSQSGKFFFSGTKEDLQPFVADPTNPDGVVYRGDQGQRSIAFPGGTESPVSVDGQTIFLNPDNFLGSGRTAGATGAATPAPPVGIGIAFSNGLSGSITADLPSFFVAASPTTAPSAGDTATVQFTSTDGAINAIITTAPFAGGESTAQIATALNTQVAATPALAGKVTFTDQGGNLKLVESDTVGVGLNFTSSSTGTLVTGLEAGGAIGGLSAQEIAAALNVQVAANPSLSSAKVQFSAVNGQVQLTSSVDVTFTAADFARGAGFVSGLAGQHTVGGAESANAFRALTDLHSALAANDPTAISNTIDGLQRAVQHISKIQGFYGAAERQVLAAIDALGQSDVVNQQKLSALQDADVAQAASNLRQAQVNEQAALAVTAQESGRNLFDFLA